MSNCGIFHSKNYLKFVERTQKVCIRFFKANKDGKFAEFPHYIQNNILFSLRYGGIVSSSKSKEFERFVSEQFMEYCKAQKVSAVRIRNNPFRSTIPVGHVIKKEPIVFIHLNQKLNDLYAGISQKHNERIQKAKNENLMVCESREIRYLLLFYEFYSKLLLRKSGKPRNYLFFEELYNCLKHYLNLVYVVQNDRTVAVSIVLESKPNIFMLYGAMNEDGYKKCAKHLMIYELMRRYKKRKYSRLILGTGVDGKRDPIYRFKQGFTNREAYIYTYGRDV